LVVVGAAAAWVYYREWKNVPEVDYLGEIGSSLRRFSGEMTVLDPSLQDADGDLVADPPKDPAKQIDPAVLVFAPLPSPGGETAAAWDEFKAHLAKVTGKTVEYQDTPDLVRLRELLRNGRIHVCGVNTGGVPAAVNAGFVPDCAPAAADGSYGYEMEFIVPADSPVKSPKDLKGKSVKLVAASSHSGYKAPLVVLREEFHLVPDRDFKLSISGSHDRSIGMVANKACDAAPVANDMLRRAEARGDIKSGQYRSIYKSAKFPPGAYGHVYSLKPDLAAKVREAFLAFDWKGTGLEKTFGSSGQAKFVAVDYRKDWQYVRDVDGKLLSWGK
jgi:phosphonate transport system substrate-binding protein